MWTSDGFFAQPEDAIAFAWSAPLRDLAIRIGISDVALKKLLTAQGIVTPPQGHWNRVHARRNVVAPPRPKPRRPGESGRVELDGRFRGHVAETGRMPEEGPFASNEVPEDLADLRAQMQPPAKSELRLVGQPHILHPSIMYGGNAFDHSRYLEHG